MTEKFPIKAVKEMVEPITPNHVPITSVPILLLCMDPAFYNSYGFTASSKYGSISTNVHDYGIGEVQKKMIRDYILDPATKNAKRLKDSDILPGMMPSLVPAFATPNPDYGPTGLSLEVFKYLSSV